MPNDDERETIRNEERGCGFLKHGKAYVRSPPRGKGGVMPPFVKFDPPIPYLERSKFRGYEYFPGISFELSVTGAVDVPTSHAEMATPLGNEDPRLDEIEGGVPPEFTEENEFLQETVRLSSTELGEGSESGITSTDPPGEIWRHIARMTGTADGDHAGDVTAFASHDLYMHVGASYYETPEEFITEVEEQGLSKAIPVSQSQEPPRINPGRTRLFLVHPNATGEENDKAGVIGYVYLHRTVYTEDEEGRFPAWAKEYGRAREDMDLVHVGDQIYEDGTRATTVDEVVEENGSSEAESEPEAVVPSDKEGRDVEGVPASSLDEDEISDQLDDAADEIEEFAEDYEEVEEGVYANAKLIEVPRPDECPDCGEETEEESMEGGGAVTFCPSCGWDNSTTVNAAWVEHDLRQMEYNALRSKASDELDTPPANPSYEELIRAFLKEWGLL